MIFEFPVLNEEDRTLPIYIEELGYLENQDHVVRDNNYRNNQILICTAGSGKLIIEDNTYSISSHSVFVTRNQVPHEYYAVEEPWTIHWIVFNGTYLDQLFPMLNLGNHEVFTLPSTKPMSDIFEKALTMIQSNNSKKHLECSIMLYSMITQLSYCKGNSNPRKNTTKKQRTFGKLLTYVEDHYYEDISLDTLGNTFDLSPYYVSRIFKEFAQMGLITYINKYRISMAKKILLQKPESSVKIIAKQTGFKNSSYFCALFKKSEGVSPVAFRKLHGLA